MRSIKIRNIMGLMVLAPAIGFAAASEITVDLKLDNIDYVSCEKLRGIVDVVNLSPDIISVGNKHSADRFFIEVFRSSDRSQLEEISTIPFVSSFVLKPNEGQKLETFLGDHYGLRNAGRYLAKPVLVHDGVRYEGQMRAFDVVPGMRIGGALQLFANNDELRREFDLVCWSRAGRDHLFLKAHDSGNGNRNWHTTDLGQLMKITKPTISVMPSGEVIVLHRVDADNFVRTEFWSVPDGIELNTRAVVKDPETAGAARVRDMYKESGGVKAKDNPWWKFW